MKEKAIRQSFIFALGTSTFALLISVIAIPLLQADLEHLRIDVLSDMDDFKEATDTLWNELLQIERDSAVVKRDISLVYSYRPFVHRKSKLQRKRLRHRHITRRKSHKHSRRHNAKLFEILKNRPELKERWGKRIAVTMKTPPQRVYGQTIINKSGREVFSDAELIGLPGERKSGKPRKGHHQEQCGLQLNPECPQGPPGPPGEDADDGDDGLDGLPGLDGKSADDNYGRDCILCPVGPIGPPGPPGPPGPVGPDGPDGEKGLQAVGLSGPKGAKGESGPAGAAGAPGAPGEPGNNVVRWLGSPGEKGVPGSIGVPGPAGGRGPDGETGLPGQAGTDGPPGLKGKKGRKGKAGRRGKKGRPAFADHYCKCPSRTKSSRGYAINSANTTAPEADQYPKDLGLD